MKKILYIILQCTWGILQTVLGAIVFLVCIKEKHYTFQGSVVTEWNLKSGVSLGLFIFTDKRGILLEHEYSHTFQSLILGPLYLPFISLPSLLWAGLPCFKKLRHDKKLHYNSFFTEKWAEAIRSEIFRNNQNKAR